MTKLLLKNFLFCFQLRKGCIIIGVLGIIGRSWAGVGNGIGWIYIIPMASLDPWRSVISITNGIVGVVGGITLLYGVLKKKEIIIKMYLPITGFLVLLLSVSACLGTYTVNCLGWRGHHLSSICQNDGDCLEIVIWTIYTLTLDIIDIFAYLYFIVCVYSYLEQFKHNAASRTEEQCSNQDHLMTL